MEVSSITVSDTYRYDTERIPPFDFVLGNSDPETFKKDFIIFPSSSVIIGDTEFICLGELPYVATSKAVVLYTEVPSRGLERIRARQPAVIRRARELRATLGDPLVELARILQDIPVKDDVWDRIVQEPYG
jgi:hypothetical protein